MLASIYCRISRDRVGAGLGVATQQADCHEVAKSLGCTIVSIHTDNDMSAYRTRKPRPGYKALLAEVEAGEINAVIAWHTDRLHRSPAELEDYVAACETHGIKTYTVKAGNLDLTTASGLMIARMLGATARYEVDPPRQDATYSRCQICGTDLFNAVQRERGTYGPCYMNHGADSTAESTA